MAGDEDLRARTERGHVSLGGMLRRLAVRFTSAAGFWQLLGYRGAYGEDETVDGVEVFGGVGFASRPKAGSASAEAILVNLGGRSSNHVVIATRDKRIEISLEDGETAIFNEAGARVVCKADGTVWATDASGAASELALKSDVVELRAKYLAHTHAGNVPVPSLAPELPAAVVGTTVLKGK